MPLPGMHGARLTVAGAKHVETVPSGYHITIGTMLLISVTSDGVQGNSDSDSPSISADGRFVTFHSTASNLVSGDSNGFSDVFVHDLQTSTIERVSVAGDGTQGNGTSKNPSISSDGRFVAFWSFAGNLVSGDTNAVADIFVRDRQTAETTRISVSTGGSQGASASDYPSISADGRFVAFQSVAWNLVAEDTNNKWDAFIHDRQTGETTRVSIASDGMQGNGDSGYPSISSDGRFVVFESTANNLVTGDTNAAKDLFIHDRQTSITERVSVSGDGTQANDLCGYSNCPSSVSTDGRFVAFQSRANNLVAEDTNDWTDVFVRDRQLKETTRVSVSSDGAQGNNISEHPFISSDGRLVAFQSLAGNLVPGDTGSYWDIFTHDRQTGETTRVSINDAGEQGNGYSRFPVISDDMKWIAFHSSASNLVSGDGNGYLDVFETDWGTRSEIKIYLPLVTR